MLGFKKLISFDDLSLVCADEIESEYYVRMSVVDEVGVLSKTSSIFAQFGISIDSFLQKSSKNQGRTTLLFSTHKCKEAKIKDALKHIESLDFVKESPAMIRIED